MSNSFKFRRGQRADRPNILWVEIVLPPRCLICHTRRNEYFLGGNCGIKLSTTVDLDELARPMRDMICSMTNLWDELH